MVYLERTYEEGLDLLTFFPREKTISAHSTLWPLMILSSLRLKNSVIVTSGLIPSLNSIDQSKRWVAGPDWCWLAPRSLSVLNTFFLHNPSEFDLLLNFLRTSK